jgi:ribosomal protein L21E
MKRYEGGDRVRLDIPNEMHPDHDRLHGLHGQVIEILEDDAGATTGDERESYIFRVELDKGGIEDVRWRDIWPE